jgi:hypothetical protein
MVNIGREERRVSRGQRRYEKRRPADRVAGERMRRPAREGPDTADGTSPTASSPTPSPSPSPPQVAEARLDGEWKVDVTVVELTIPLTDREAGDVFHRDWVFTPKCPEGPCDVEVKRESPPSSIRHELEYQGITYVDELRYEGSCADAVVNATAVWELDVVDADYIDGVWRATRIEGTVDADFKPTPEAKAAGCQAGRERNSFEGKLVSG